MLCVRKTNGQLEFQSRGGYENRHPSTEWCIRRADEVYHWPDFEPVAICTEDVQHHKYAYTGDFAVPDFNFHCWKEVGLTDYVEVTTQMSESGLSPPEVDKVGWIGAMTHHNRRRMIEIGKTRTDLFDFVDMNWIRNDPTRLTGTTYISMPDLAKKYSILLDIEGNGYSGRLKYLLWSRRPVIMVDRPHREFFFAHMKPWVHYVPVKRDLTDLVENTEWIKRNPEKALEIAENAHQFCLRHLTRESCYSRWNDIVIALKG